MIRLYLGLFLCLSSPQLFAQNQVNILSAPTEGYIFPIDSDLGSVRYGVGESRIDNQTSNLVSIEMIISGNGYQDTTFHSISTGIHDLEVEIPQFMANPYATYSLKVKTPTEEIEIDNLSVGIHLGAVGHSLMAGAGNDTSIVQDKVWVSHLNNLGNWTYVPAQANNSSAPGYIGGTGLLLAIAAADSLNANILLNNKAVSSSLIQDCVGQINQLAAIPNFSPSWIMVWTGGNDIAVAIGNKTRAQLETEMSSDYSMLYDHILSAFPEADQLYFADNFPAGEQELGMQNIDWVALNAKIIEELPAQKGPKAKYISSTQLGKMQDDLRHWESEAILDFAPRLGQSLRAHYLGQSTLLEPIRIQSISWDAIQSQARLTLSDVVVFRKGTPNRAFYGRTSNGTIIVANQVSLHNGNEIRLNFNSRPDDIIFVGQQVFKTNGTPYYPIANVYGNGRSLAVSWWEGLDLIFPIEILNFEVRGNKIYWNLISEFDNERAFLERSLDNQAFEEVQEIYFFDKKALDVYEEKEWPAEELFFRLKMIDQNGQITYSGSRTMRSQPSDRILFGPNPVQINQQIRINKEAYVRIYDLRAKLIYESLTTVRTFPGPEEAGIYLLQFDGQEFKKLWVQE
ncbi:MAG: hypothetical protein R8P61_03955 [Bacteroidia bacterium]|nr:hypothetical protein [Bacteroidia bacterium]